MEKFDFYKKTENIKLEAKDIMSGSWGYSAKQMLIMLLLSLIIVAVAVVVCVLNPVWYVITLCSFFGLFLLYVIYYGVQVYFYNFTNNLKANSSDLFAGFKCLFKLLALFIAKLFVLVFGLCLFVYFGFDFELRYCMSSLVLYENPKNSSTMSLKGSKRLMKGNKKRLVKLRYKSIGWILLCLTVVGAIWALPYLMVEKSLFYNDLKTDF